MDSNDFIIEAYDEETGLIRWHYWTTQKGYMYTKYTCENGESSKPKRISEKRFISAIETLYNA